MTSAFSALSDHPRLRGLAEAAEAHWAVLPDYALWRARLFAEKLAEDLWRRTGGSPSRTFATQVAHLLDAGRIDADAAATFEAVRKAGNRAVHDAEGTAEQAREALERCWALAALVEPALAGQAYAPPAGTARLTDAELIGELRRTTLAADVRLSLPARRSGSDRLVQVNEVFEPPWMIVGSETWSWQNLVDALRAGRRIAVTGAAGEGKSTLAFAMVAELARHAEGPVPLYLPARRVDGRPLIGAAATRARTELGVPLDDARLAAWLRSGTAVLVIDGLDECPPDDRARVLAGLAALSCSGSNGILVTARPAAWREAAVSGFEECSLGGWSTDALFRYLERAGLSSGRSVANARAVLTGSQALATLARLPLLGALLIEVLLDSGTRVADPVELIDRGLDLLLRHKPEERGRGVRVVDAERTREIVESLALEDANGLLGETFDDWVAFVSSRVGGDFLLAEEWVAFLIDETGLGLLFVDDSVSFAHAILRDRLAVRAALRAGSEPLQEVLRSSRGVLSSFEVALVREAARRDPTFLRRLHTALGKGRVESQRGSDRAVSLQWSYPLGQVVDDGATVGSDLAEDLLAEVAEDCGRVALEDDRSANSTAVMLGPSEHARWVARLGPEAAGRVIESRIAAGDGAHLVGAVALGLEVHGVDWVRERLVRRPDLGDRDELMVLWPHSSLGRTTVGHDLEFRGDSIGDIVASKLSSPAASRVVPAWHDGDWLAAAFAVLVLPSSAELVEATAGWVLGQALSAGLPASALALLQRAPRRQFDVVVSPGPAHARLWPVLRGRAVELAASAPRRRAPSWRALLQRSKKFDLLRSGSMLPRLPTRWFDSAILDGAPCRAGPLPGADALRSGEVELESFDARALAMARHEGGSIAVAELFAPIVAALEPAAPSSSLVPASPRAARYLVEPAMAPGQLLFGRSLRAADWIAAALLTRGLPDDARLAHLRHRVMCRSTLDAWPAIELAVARWAGEPVAEALALALTYAAGASLAAWPHSPEHAARLRRAPTHWLARTAWHLSHLAAGAPSTRHQGGLFAALADGRDHPVARDLRVRLGLASAAQPSGGGALRG